MPAAPIVTPEVGTPRIDPSPPVITTGVTQPPQ
jgi:hypothetical protein